MAGGDLDSCFRLLLAFRGNRESKVDRSALMTTPEILERVLQLPSWGMGRVITDSRHLGGRSRAQLFPFWIWRWGFPVLRSLI